MGWEGASRLPGLRSASEREVSSPASNLVNVEGVFYFLPELSRPDLLSSLAAPFHHLPTTLRHRKQVLASWATGCLLRAALSQFLTCICLPYCTWLSDLEKAV